MAIDEGLRSITLEADATLAEYTGVPGLPGSASPNGGNQYKFVKVTGAHTAGLADTTANEIVVGVLQNKPQYTGSAATVAIRGVSKVLAGGSVNAGNAVKVNADGEGVAATLPGDAEAVVGVAISSGADGELISVLLATPTKTTAFAAPA
jgi:hypothetical protein